jgi:hypothetical protein
MIAVRGPAVIDDDLVTLQGADAEIYDFRSSYEFLSAAASLETPESVLRFVARYGLAFASPGLEEPSERLKEIWPSEPLWEYEQLGWNLSTTRRLYRLAHLVLAGNTHEIPSLRWELASDMGLISGQEEEAIAGRDELSFRSLNSAELVGRALTSVVISLNVGFESHDARFMTGFGPEAGICLAPAATTLAGQAWLQLAIEVIQKYELRECEACGAIFTVTDPRKRFCSPRCSGRSRAKRFRQRHRLSTP